MASYIGSFTDQTRIVIRGVDHQLGTNHFWIEVCGAPYPDALAIHPTTYDLTMAYMSPQTGTVVLMT